jgi:bifunctional non-homologous end joining protein LigD
LPIRQLKELRQELEKIERTDSPFASKIRPNAPVHWVEPKLVCEVSFSEWTRDKLMRQPIFEGLRPDKKPKEVKREMPKLTKKDKDSQKPDKKGGGGLEFSHLDKVFFPEAGYTKGELIKYYQQVMPFILPYLTGRPHNLLRQPNGYKGKSFFQKDVAGVVPDWVKTASIYSESNQKNIDYYVCDSPESLLYMVQLGCIEINPWNSTVKKLQKPDWIVIDLDPEAIAFKKVVEVALEVKRLADELKIPTYPKTSGKTGIHIYIPTKASYDYKQARQFGELLANIINQRLPKITSVKRDPKERQKRIYLDFLQNREGQTLAAPYSVRPTKEASVSTPLHWDEVNQKLEPASFTIKNIGKRLDKQGDLWRPVLKQKVDIKAALSKIGQVT